MNRIERRAAKKQGLPVAAPTLHHFTTQQLKARDQALIEEYERRIKEIKKDYINVSVDTIMAASIVTLHDTFGFGKQRLQKYIDLMQNHLECITEGYVSLDELKALYKEFGISIQKKKGD